MDNCSFKSLVSLSRGRAVGHADVCPNGRMAGSDAGKVAKAGGGIGEVVFAVRMINQSVDIGKGGQVRQVGNSGKNIVVFFGTHGGNLRTNRLP